MKFLLTLLLILLGGCGRSQPVMPEYNESELSKKVTLYTELIRTSRAGPDGFIHWKTCDSSLKSGVYGAAVPGAVNLPAALAADGSWRRNTQTLPDCFYSTLEEREAAGTTGGSASSISRDMFVGILWWIWRNQRLDLAVHTMEYAKANDYIMGSGDPARISLMNNLTKLLADMIYVMSNKKVDYLEERVILIPFLTYPTGLGDYEAHIQMWQILLDGEVNGGLRPKQMDVIRSQVTRRPDNPLFQAAMGKWITGDLGPAYEALDHPRWPEDRLPERSDYCTDTWIATDNPVDMAPCTATAHSRFEPSGWEVVAVYNLVMRPR